jgi:hypothetical protein
VNPEAPLPARLPSEDVIISAPMSYTGSAQRIMRVRRRARSEIELAALTALAVGTVTFVWLLVTVWYLMWGLLLVPYRLYRRGERKRKADALRHRELLVALQSSHAPPGPAPPPPPHQRIGDAEREQAVDELRVHMLAGRLTPEEFEHRVGQVHDARTHAEISAIRSDLPADQTDRSPRWPPA